MQTREAFAKASLDEPFAIHSLRILTKTKEDEEYESSTDLDPAVEEDRSTGS